jgi:hypothetical protein
MHHLIRALATAHIEDLHRDASQRHTIRLARRVAREPGGRSRGADIRGRMWTGRRDCRSRRDRLAMHRGMRSERL